MFKFGGNTPKKILFNGLNVANVVYRTVKVWVDKVLATIGATDSYSLVLENSTGEDLVNYKIYGNTTQSGTKPTPDIPIEIKNVGNKNNLMYEISVKVNDEITYIHLKEPLRKIGKYADYIDYKNQKVVRYIEKVVLDGTGDYFSSDNALSKTYRVMKFFKDGMEYNPLICDKLIPITAGTSSDDRENIQFSSDAVFIRIYKSRLNSADVTGVKEYLASNNITVYYVLKTPTEEEIELPTISTAEDTNEFTIATEVVPSSIDIDYYKYDK